MNKKLIAPDNTALPDFIIAGAMKCGTTTLHNILNEHPDVFIPDSEIHFFDMDDIIEHPEFNFYQNNNWIHPDINNDYHKYWQWYSEFFAEAEENMIIGEDSTGYLASKYAPKRIAQQKKNIKIIIILRNPIDRAYSHYWHNLRAGRLSHTFENTIRYYPNTILRRSCYFEQLSRYYKYFPDKDLKVIIFEDFIKNKKQYIKDICTFINVTHDQIPEKSIDKHSNKARMPLFPKMQLISNKLNRDAGNWLYRGHFPFYQKKIEKRKTLPRLIRNLHNSLNPKIDKKPPKMNPDTRRFLKEYFLKELAGIEKLIGDKALRIWFQE